MAGPHSESNLLIRLGTSPNLSSAMRQAVTTPKMTISF